MRGVLSSLLLLGLVLLILGGCGGREKEEITLSGAWALYPMVARWNEEFQKVHSKVRFELSAGGAGKGMADLLAGQVDIGMVSREVFPQEKERGAYPIAVTKDAVFPTMNAANPVLSEVQSRGIKRETLRRIWITGEITTWGQVIGRPEMTEPIQVFTRSDACGAAQTWAKYLGGEQEDLLGVGVYGDPGLAEAVRQNPLGIGYNNLNFAYDPTTGEPVAGIQVIPIDLNENGQIGPEEELDTKERALQAVAAGVYPSPPARELYLVTKGQPKGLVKEFIRWTLTDGQRFVEEVGYIPLAQTKLDSELAKLD